jgi:methyl-galactoside transport system ATP-binding protein
LQDKFGGNLFTARTTAGVKAARPTRGIDIGARTEIYQLTDELAAQGKGIVLVSSAMPELLRCCDQILVMQQGRPAGIVDVATTTQEQLLSFATGGR